MKKIVKIILILIGAFILGNGIFYIYCLITPKFEINKAQSYYLYDSNSELVFNDNNNWIELDNISPYLINATISTEDKYFYKHFGFDYLRIVKALFTNIKNMKLSEGASTITQQYARNLFLNYDKTWARKIEEAMLAFELETHYTKDEILEGYLNTINYGGVYGIENASLYYFNKSASELSLAEASILAGVPQSPSNYSPISNFEASKERQKVVLSLMTKNNYITEEEMETALNSELSFVGNKSSDNISSLFYYRDAVINEINKIDQIPDSLLETGGIKIYTVLDKNLQKDLENNIDSYMTEEDMQVAAVMINPADGGVMALVGGKDYNASQFNRAIDSKRQVGSTMKSFLYYAALESGFTASSTFTSERTTFNFDSSGIYSPKNYNDTYANGPICMGTAISYSDNIYAVKTHLFLGEDTLVNMAKRVGINSELASVPSLALGTEEMSLLELVQGYSAFANDGYKVTPHFITKVEDSNGNILYEFKNNVEYVLNSSITFILSEMLTYTYDTLFIDYNYPTVISLLPKITNKYAIKTGTTDTDALIVGYNKNMVLGIWNGYDNNSKITNSSVGHKDIWISTVENYFKDKDALWYEIPSNVVSVMVNPINGKIATESDNNTKNFYYLKGTEPIINNIDYDLDAVFNESNGE